MCSVHGVSGFKEREREDKAMFGLHKRNASKENKRNGEGEPSMDSDCSWTEMEEPKLSLMEELLLLVMDPRGYVSMWNDQLSRSLRGCILIELWMRGKLELEEAGMRRKNLSRRVVVVKNTSNTNDSLLNDALKLMSDGSAHTIADWISYLSGETWNPLKLKYHMRFVRDRLFKELVERRILTTVKTNYWLLDAMSHPISDFSVQQQLRTKIKNALLEQYCSDIHRFNKRTLSLLILTQYSGGLEDIIASLPSDLKQMALRRIQDLENTDFEVECRRGNPNDLHWAVFAALSEPFVLL